MRKTKLFIVALGLLATMGSTSCKKETKVVREATQNNNFSTSKTAQEEEDYYDEMIRTVSYGIVDLSTNPTFRQVVANQVALQFDGDDNVLLADLETALAASGINLQQEMTNSLNAQGKQSLIPNVLKAVQGFEYFTDTLYTQIYIPFITGKNIVATTPTICMLFEDQPILASIKKEGAIITEGTTNEVFATGNNVFVVSINERDSKSKWDDDDEGDGGTSKTTTPGDRTLKIDQIKISDKKEGWGAGRADIAFFAIATRFACARQPDEAGTPFSKIANPELDTWFRPTGFGNLIIANTTNTSWEQSQGEEISIIFYELDRRNKFRKTYAPSYCSYAKIEYVSQESMYGVVYPIFSNYPSYSPTLVNYGLSGGQFMLAGWLIP